MRPECRWRSEHAPLAGVASAAPEVPIAPIAVHPNRPHIGSGGLTPPNPALLRVTAAFRMLEARIPAIPASAARDGECGTLQLMIVCNLHDHAARLRSDVLTAGAFGD